jgi:hypothetical protein
MMGTGAQHLNPSYEEFFYSFREMRGFGEDTGAATGSEKISPCPFLRLGSAHAFSKRGICSRRAGATTSGAEFYGKMDGGELWR